MSAETDNAVVEALDKIRLEQGDAYASLLSAIMMISTATCQMEMMISIDCLIQVACESAKFDKDSVVAHANNLNKLLFGQSESAVH